ncbi:hypothetical protein pb186bvf_015875 [Paramecium bursaria]
MQKQPPLLNTNNDVFFNNLSLKEEHDIHTQLVDRSKILDNSQNGVKHILPTKQYLEQIDVKYQKEYQQKQQHKHNPNKPSNDYSHSAIIPNNQTPAKFRKQELFNNDRSAIQQVRVNSEIPQTPQRQQVQPNLLIPNDISLSKGVSERYRS